MNNKVLAAFLGGLIVASGITYFAMRRPEPAAQAAAPAAVISPANVKTAETPAPLAEAAPAPEQPAPPAEKSSKSSWRVARAQRPAPAALRSAPAASAPAPVAAAPQPAPVAQPQPQSVEVARASEPPAPAPAPTPSFPKVEPPPPTPNSVTLAAGTTLTVRLGETLSTERNRPGDTFSATLDQPLVVDGFVIAERGSRAQGRVVEAERAGKVKGVAQLGIELTYLTTSDGQRIRLNTSAVQQQGESSKKSDAMKVGAGAAIGAAIGAIAGGGKGAGIGAGAGGAAGAGDVLLTRGKPAELKVETRATFRLAEPLTITEKTR